MSQDDLTAIAGKVSWSNSATLSKGITGHQDANDRLSFDIDRAHTGGSLLTATITSITNSAIHKSTASQVTIDGVKSSF